MIQTGEYIHHYTDLIYGYLSTNKEIRAGVGGKETRSREGAVGHSALNDGYALSFTSPWNCVTHVDRDP
jgi:hypothetical protein